MPTRITAFDDSANLRRLYEYVLSRIGYEVHTFAEEGNLSREVAATLPDLVILGNITSIDTEKLEIIRQLRELPGCHSLPVLLITTGLESVIDSHWIQALDRVYVLGKPFDYFQLVDSIANCIQDCIVHT